MKLVLSRALFFISLISIVLVGCGGGGGGGSSGTSNSNTSTSSTPSTGSLTLNQNTLSFTGYAAQDSTPIQTISANVTFSNTYKVGVYAPSGSQLNWLGLSINQTSDTNFDFAFFGKPSTVGTGNYSINAVIRASDANGAVLGEKAITISLQVKASLSVGAGTVLFNSVFGGTAPTPNSIPITGAGLTWTTTADQPWISLGNSSGAGNGSLSIGVAPAGLAPGVHNGLVTVQSSDAAQSVTIQVSYTVTLPSLSYQANNLDFQGGYGEVQPSRTLNLMVNGSQGWSYSATASNAWITLSQSSGAAPGNYTIGIDADNEPAIFTTQYGSITFVATLNGVSISTTVPVTLTVTQPQITVSVTQLNFSGLNGTTFVPQAVTVGINNRRQLTLTASPSAKWIVVSAPDPATPNLIYIGVDPGATSLASGTYHGQVQLNVNSLGAIISTTIDVSLTLSQASIRVSQQSVTLGGDDGRDLTPQNIDLIAYVGTISYPWTATVTNAPWVQ